MSIERILIVDDDKKICTLLAKALKHLNLEIDTIDRGKKAVTMHRDQPYDLVITDMKMPDLTGLEVLQKVKEENPGTVVIVITGHGSIENAVEAMRKGAFHYLVKPFTPDTLEAIIEKSQEHAALVNENQFLRQQVSGGPKRIIAESPCMKEIMEQVANVAQSNASIMITGESGTGKEVVAQAIYRHSDRAKNPFIKVNCAAIPETLIESEFFGHEKGSFTGASQKRIGRFELADEGTLLLDEITEIPIGLQAKFLRALQEREFERVGGSKPVKVDVRVISTSNRNIQQAIQEKVLRDDLYYRLNVVPLYIPPLRERPEDIIPLAEYFLELAAHENHRKLKKLTAQAKKVLLSYRWPGNVRELANVIERVVVMSDADSIKADHLILENHSMDAMSLQDLEKKAISETIQRLGNSAQAADILGISEDALKDKLKKYGMK